MCLDLMMAVILVSYLPANGVIFLLIAFLTALAYDYARVTSFS